MEQVGLVEVLKDQQGPDSGFKELGVLFRQDFITPGLDGLDQLYIIDTPVTNHPVIEHQCRRGQTNPVIREPEGVGKPVLGVNGSLDQVVNHPTQEFPTFRLASFVFPSESQVVCQLQLGIQVHVVLGDLAQGGPYPGCNGYGHRSERGIGPVHRSRAKEAFLGDKVEGQRVVRKHGISFRGDAVGISVIAQAVFPAGGYYNGIVEPQGIHHALGPHQGNRGSDMRHGSDRSLAVFCRAAQGERNARLAFLEDVPDRGRAVLPENQGHYGQHIAVIVHTTKNGTHVSHACKIVTLALAEIVFPPDPGEDVQIPFRRGGAVHDYKAALGREFNTLAILGISRLLKQNPGKQLGIEDNFQLALGIAPGLELKQVQ